MKTLLLSTLLLLSSITFSQINWFTGQSLELHMPMASFADAEYDNAEKIEYPVNIKYYTMAHDNIIYFNWVIKSKKPCWFLVEQSDDGEHFDTADLVKNCPCPYELWYGVKLQDIKKRYYRVVQVFENGVRLEYPSKVINSFYEAVSYKKNVGERRWIDF